MTARTRNLALAFLVGALAAGASGALSGASSAAPTASAPQCWVDVYNDYAIGGPDRASAATESDAIGKGREAMNQDSSRSSAENDSESIAADPNVAAARRALYDNARRQGTGQAPGTSDWVYTDDTGAVRGLLVLEEVRGAWHVLEEHVLVNDGRCTR